MKDKEFDNILNECLERILGGETLEQCLRRYPGQAAELKPLLETFLAAREASAIQPRPEFKDRARYHFRSALGEKAAAKRRPFLGWMPRWATALAIVLVVLLAGGGTVAAAGNSMPDSVLYPVKLAAEKVQLTLTSSSLGKVELCADFADRRVAEIVYMAEKGDAGQVEAATERLEDRLAMLAVFASELEGDDADMLSITSESGASEATAVPSAAAEEAAVVGEEGEVDKNGQPQDWSELKVEVAGAADNNSSLLRGILDSVPESVRAALLEAIAVSEDGYEKVLEALD